MKPEAYVYLFFNEETGAAYIGSTINIERRLRDHNRELKNNTHYNKKFQASFNSNPNFTIDVLPCGTAAYAREVEDALIKEHWGKPDLLNLSYDVQSNRLSADVSQETRLKQSVSMRQFYQNGGQNPMQGKKHSEEIKQLLSQKAKEQFSDQKQRDRMSEVMKTKMLDSEFREKAINRLLSSHSDPSVRRKMSEANIRRFSRPEEREKQSQRAIERYSSTNIKDVLREAALKNWQDPAFREKFTKKISIDGKIFNSLTEAATEYNISNATVTQRGKSSSEQFKDWKLL